MESGFVWSSSICMRSPQESLSLGPKQFSIGQDKLGHHCRPCPALAKGWEEVNYDDTV